MFSLSDIKDKREPDFTNLLKVLRRETPSRYTPFEFFLNGPLEEEVTGMAWRPGQENYLRNIRAYAALGYDYVTIQASDFNFEHKDNNHNKASVSVNEGAVITDWKSFEAYQWKDPRACYEGRIEYLTPHLPEGMKFIVWGPSGVLENVTALVGYDNLCYLLADDPALVEAVFREVGSRLVEYYQTIIDYDSVGAIISNDDWGFNTQTMFAPAQMREYVFPYHRQIVQLAHRAGKPVILHSCGNLTAVMDDIIDDMQFDGKHSYEDKILPVEDAYDRYGGRIAVIGGIDLDFVCRATPQEVYQRSLAMLEKTGGRGYALGTGNSIPEYVPHENYYAMLAAAILN